MVYYVYDVNITERSNNGNNEFDATYTIVTPTPPTENPELDMAVAVNNYLKENNTNTKVYNINECEIIEHISKENVENKYNYYFNPDEGKTSLNIINRIKNLVSN